MRMSFPNLAGLGIGAVLLVNIVIALIPATMIEDRISLDGLREVSNI